MEVLRKAKVYRHCDNCGVWIADVARFSDHDSRRGFLSWRKAYDYAHDIQESRRYLEPCS